MSPWTWLQLSVLTVLGDFIVKIYQKKEPKVQLPASKLGRSWVQIYLFLAIYWILSVFYSSSISLHMIQGFQSFSQLCKIKGEQSKKKKKTYCVHYLSTQYTSDSRTAWVCSVGCDEVYLYALIFNQIPVWHVSAAVWGLIKPMLEEVNDFDWTHHSELFHHFLLCWSVTKNNNISIRVESTRFYKRFLFSRRTNCML